MEVHRAVTTFRRGCEASLNIHTGQVDAGPIYGTEEAYVQSTLREPNTCRMRVSEGDFLPLTTRADGEGRFFLISGDVRSSEHSLLAAQHMVWVREHNRICEEVNKDPDNESMSEDAKFDLVRNVIIGKFQQIVLTEFLPALGITQTDLQEATRLINTPDVSVEFSIAYRCALPCRTPSAVEEACSTVGLTLLRADESGVHFILFCKEVSRCYAGG